MLFLIKFVKVILMIRRSTEYLEPGMKVAKTVYSSVGQILIAVGMVLDTSLINRLIELGIGSVYVGDELGLIDEYPDVVSEPIRLLAIQNIRTVMDGLQRKHQLNVKAIRETSDNLVNEILRNRNILLSCCDIRSFDDYIFSHSINVCILSVMMAVTMGYNYLKLTQLGIGALLSDIGMTRIDKYIFDKPKELTQEEFSQVKMHTELGFEMLRTSEDIPLLSAHVAYQHHERWNGMGYPRNLAGNDIHDYARIVAVADVFDSLTADRPYRKAYSIDEALEYINTMSTYYFDPECVNALMANVAKFPPGSIVILSTGEIGQVVNVNQLAPTRPLIRLVTDCNKKVISGFHQVDLYKQPDLQIECALTGSQNISNLG
ncbi:MAG: HD-GYP domain-containing protein [Firmicutes bacterium HGW-Firmicutes-15]|nr:MAG: HD-GYP domain-containing protein [Firmicutes bacterium HGW-Firmicutes-15]